jgi:hypothetical protein
VSFPTIGAVEHGSDLRRHHRGGTGRRCEHRDAARPRRTPRRRPRPGPTRQRHPLDPRAHATRRPPARPLGRPRPGGRGRHARPRPRRVPLRDAARSGWRPRPRCTRPAGPCSTPSSSVRPSAGAEFRFGVDVRGLLRGDDGRIVGVQSATRRGTTDLRARVTIGADGRRSRVAAELRPAVTRASATTSAFAYAYFAGVDTDAYEWCYEHRTTAGLIPTGDGLTAVFVGVPPDRFTPELTGEPGFLRALSATFPSVGRRVAAATRVGPIRGFPGLARLAAPAVGTRLGARRRRRLLQGPHHRPRHHRRPARRRTARHALDESLAAGRPPPKPLVTTSRNATNSPSRSSPSPTASPASTGHSTEAQQLHRDMSELMQREAAALLGRDTPRAPQVA